ncbi:MAG: type I DNA topoisomerase [Clostridiales bacterium]|nr:type I DNA topoisomerase [Clostridiales bacterium]MCF8022159.1 type I DNA topoisomerase [Clostridiales bacterium]
MGKKLVIVESPAKAKSLTKFLGKNYNVKASMGHVRDLPKSQFGVDVENGFKPKYITIRGKGETIKELKSAVKKSEKVLLASDPDREGEAIAWHLTNSLGLNEDQPCRIEFNEITKDAVKEAVKHPRPIDRDRVNAQQARRILDRLVGYNLSPLLWRKIKKGLSAGRVQSVAVKLICDREEEISDFVPQEYWTITAKLAKGRSVIEAYLNKIKGKKAEISSQEQVDGIVKDLNGVNYVVEKVQKREKKRNPPAPFITSSLQQEAYRKLNFTAKKTMMVVQQLYEGIELGKEGPIGLVTYIRTDSTRISATAQEEASVYINNNYGQEYLPEKKRQSGKKGRVQDAHEAIRPTSVIRDPEALKSHLSREQLRLYRLIWQRFISSQMSPALIETTSVDISAGEYTFRVSGSVTKFPGFMKVYTEGKDTKEDDKSNKALPVLYKDDELKLRSLVPEQHFTQPPPRYTDATLVKTLEEKGIGRPSTYAPIVDTVLNRGYIVRENKKFYPTELGTLVIDLLRQHFPDVLNVEFTAEMEGQLDNVEEGEVDWVKILDKFYWPFSENLKKAEEEIGKVEIEDEVTDEVCEQCGRNLVVKMGRYGKFLACPGFPDCRYTKPLLEHTGVSCPECGGELVIRRSRKGRKFYGCSNYPNCEFVTWDQPTARKCPECGSMMVQKNVRGKEVYRCINKECDSNKKEKKKTTKKSSSKAKRTKKAAVH